MDTKSYLLQFIDYCVDCRDDPKSLEEVLDLADAYIADLLPLQSTRQDALDAVTNWWNSSTGGEIERPDDIDTAIREIVATVAKPDRWRTPPSRGANGRSCASIRRLLKADDAEDRVRLINVLDGQSPEVLRALELRLSDLSWEETAMQIGSTPSEVRRMVENAYFRIRQARNASGPLE